MKTERTIVDLVEQYFIRLGYPKKGIGLNVKTAYGQVNLVVHDQEKPRIAVEIKDESRFPEDDSKALRFHPYVRQLQSYAKALGTPYYVLTDGKTFLWFATDEVGRPELLRDPIRPTVSADAIPHGISKSLLLRVFHELRDLFYKHLGAKYIDDVAIVIYAKLLSEQGDDRLKRSLIKFGGEYDRLYDLLPGDLLHLQSSPYSTFHADAFRILDRISFNDAIPLDVLSAIDEAFIYRGSRAQTELKLPRWVTSLLVYLSQAKQGDIILDIYSNYGDIVTAASRMAEEVRVWTISNNPRNLLWARVQQLVVNYRGNDLIVGRIPPYDVYESKDFPSPDCIIASPTFGARVDCTWPDSMFYGKSRVSSEELYLELAVRWVRSEGRVIAIVPDSLLFARSKKYIRHFLLDTVHLTSVISLGSFLPQTSLRASILILDKVELRRPYEVFMADLESLDVQDTFECSEIPQLTPILKAFETWAKEGRFDPNSTSWLVETSELDTNNLTTGRYIPTEISGRGDIPIPFPMVPLTEVAEIYRGSSFKLDENGNLPVIGPAAIRAMALDASSVDRTSKGNLRSKPRTVQPGDIVINSISTYRGAAAVVTQDLVNAIANRHVIIVRPNSPMVLPEYLAIALNSKYVKDQLDKAPSGVVIPSLNLRVMGEITVPLPDLETQQQIAKRVSLLQDEWNRAQEKAADTEQKFHEALQALGLEEEQR